MPVTAAMLLSGANPTPHPATQQFIRGEKATSSVKLRRRNKDDPGAASGGNYQAMNARSKKNRHSCDFSVLNDRSQSVNYLQNDFDYITFPNGVPVVHGVCVTGDDISDALNAGSGGMPSVQSIPASSQHQPFVNGGGGGRRQRSTTSVVHITTHNNSPQHLKYSRPVSSSAMNIHHQHRVLDHHSPRQPQQQGANNYFHHAPRRSSPSHHSPNKFQSRGGAPVRMQNLPVQTRQSPSSHFMVTKDTVPLLSSQLDLRSIRQHDILPLGLAGGPARGSKYKASKPASNEFEFKLAPDPEELDKQAFLQLMKHGILSQDKKAGSQESGIFSTGSSQESPSKSAVRQPGLGRRAITQLNLREKKSRPGLFSGELARSQEDVSRAIIPGEGNGMSPRVLHDNSHNNGGQSDDQEVSIDHSSTLRKGLLWQQRDKLFSSWKERYFILTQDFLQCFKKETSRITDMGGFLFKIKLCDVDSIDLLDKKGYLTISLTLVREPKMFLRKTEGIREWYNCLCNCVKESKARKQLRGANVINHFDQKQATDSSGIESFVLNKRRLNFRRSDSTPEIHKNEPKERITLDELSNLYKNEEEAEKQKEVVILRKRMNRLSLMTDMEMIPDFSKVQMNRDSGDGKHVKQEADSGHNSLNTNRSAGSTISSKHSMGPIESHFPEMEEEDEECSLDQPTPVAGTPNTDNPHRSLCDTVNNNTAGNRLDGPRSLAGVGVIQEEDVMTISCSMPSPKIQICSPHQENKNVIEVRYRERSSPRTSAAGGSGGRHQQPSAARVHHQAQVSAPAAMVAASGSSLLASSPRDSKAHVNRLQITHV